MTLTTPVVAHQTCYAYRKMANVHRAKKCGVQAHRLKLRRAMGACALNSVIGGQCPNNWPTGDLYYWPHLHLTIHHWPSPSHPFFVLHPVAPIFSQVYACVPDYLATSLPGLTDLFAHLVTCTFNYSRALLPFSSHVLLRSQHQLYGTHYLQSRNCQ